MVIFGILFTLAIIFLYFEYNSINKSYNRKINQVEYALKDKIIVRVTEFLSFRYPTNIGGVAFDKIDALLFHDYLVNVIFKDNPNRIVEIDLDGAMGYSYIFLKLAFAGVLESYPNITFKCDDEPLLVSEIRLRTWLHGHSRTD